MKEPSDDQEQEVDSNTPESSGKNSSKKGFLRRIYANPKYFDVFHWMKLVTITGGTQVLVQITGLLSGLLIIRMLPIEEYAYYTLANTMLGTMTILADSGISNGVMAEGGKVWKDRTMLGKVLITGMDLRKKFGIGSLIITVPILVYLLRDHDASWLTIFLIVLAIIPAFFAALSDSILASVAKLHQSIKPLQRNHVEVGLSRFALNVILVILFPFTYIALTANSIPRIYGNYKLRKIAGNFADLNVKPDREVRKAISLSVKRTMPIVIYHCISGQLSIWLISFFGTTSSISQLGALGRLAMVFSVFSALFTTLVVPRFSRMLADKERMMRIFLSVQVFTLVIGGVLVGGVYLFSDPILWVLGEKYEGLHYELLLVAISNGFTLMIGVASQLCISRAWYLKPQYIIGINFVSTVLAIVFLNLTTLVGVLYFNIVVTLAQYVLMVLYGISQIRKTSA